MKKLILLIGVVFITSCESKPKMYVDYFPSADGHLFKDKIFRDLYNNTWLDYQQDIFMYKVKGYETGLITANWHVFQAEMIPKFYTLPK